MKLPERMKILERKIINNRFLKKTAIVTGGSSGIGKAVVEELCKEGANVIFTGRSEAGFKIEKDLIDQGFTAKYLQGDMGDEEFCKKTAVTAKQTGRIDYLLNNAFSFMSKGLNATTDDFLISFKAGPLAYSLMVQNVWESMRDNGGGSIVNMSSISAHIAQKERWTYNAYKGAVTQLTKCQALDLGKYKIRVNCISPAYIWTRELERNANLDGGGREKWVRIWGELHMLRRCADAVEVAGPVLFLFSDDASFITGSDLFVDGGYLGLGAEGVGELTQNAGSQ